MKLLGVRLAVSLMAAVLICLWPANAAAGQKVTLGTKVPTGQRVSMDEIDHGAWDALLRRYVDESGNVAYGHWKSSTQDMRSLDIYLATLSTADAERGGSKTAALAFWINAYNAVTIRGILREYPTTSIRNHTARVLGYNIWDDLLLTVGGRDYSLNQMEHEVLRKMGEPRIHFAIVCASRSCPRLLNEAYDAESLEHQLTKNAKAFFADPDNFQYDRARQQFRVSSILKWFGEDFGDDQAARLRTIAGYLPSQEAYKAAITNSVSISYLDYDWGLNDQATVGAARE